MGSLIAIAVLIGTAALFGVVANKLKLPALIGYVVAGLFLHATSALPHVEAHDLEFFAQIGIIFLLFILGLELDLRDLAKTGAKAFTITGVQMALSFAAGYIGALAVGVPVDLAGYVALGLSFSSTIVIVKLLGRMKELDTAHGKIAVSILLIQDIIAIAALIIISASSSEGSTLPLWLDLVIMALKGFALLVLLWIITHLVIPWMIKQTGHDRETLFVLVIAWALVAAALAGSEQVGFSPEIGALLAGVSLSTRKETLQIESWTRPLRDFFLTVFFVLLGYQLDLGSLDSIVGPALLLSLMVVTLKPLIVFSAMLLHRYQVRVSLSTALSLGQISEFGLLVMTLIATTTAGADELVAMITLVGIITMAISSYLITYHRQIVEFLGAKLNRLDKFTHGRRYGRKHVKDRVVVIGFHRLATGLVEQISSRSARFVVVDNDEQSLELAESLGANTLYGDLRDEDLLPSLRLEHAKLIISTVPDHAANLGLLAHMRQQEIDTPLVVPASDDKSARELYDEGASFVIYPHLFASQRLARIVASGNYPESLGRYASRELAELEVRASID